MIELNFGESGGGVRQFRDWDQVLKYTDKESGAWATVEAFEALRKQNPHAAQTTSQLQQRWRQLGQQLQSFQSQFGDNENQIRHQLQAQINGTRLVSRSSPEGAAVLDVAENGGPEEVVGAVQFVLLKPNEPLPQNLSKARQIGAWAAWVNSVGITTKGAASARRTMRALVGELEARAGEFVTELERIEEEHRRELTDFSEELKGHQGEFAKYRETVATEVETERGEWRDEWSKQFELFTEQLKLRAAVSQWSDRAEDHEKAFKRTRRWAIGLGAVGLLCSALVFTGALEFAGWLFSSVLSADPQATAGGLRPTWQEELIFATSTSLLYLTLFLWGMRILVRTLMTEHHLGIDARGRASMAHTYLALIEKDAATDADRAIVLASLFRPVADGLVKQDDALPAVTPATILSGHLAAAAGR